MAGTTKHNLLLSSRHCRHYCWFKRGSYFCCKYPSIQLYAQRCTEMNTHTHTHIHTHIYTRMQAHTHTHTIHSYRHIWNTYEHTYTHSQRYLQPPTVPWRQLPPKQLLNYAILFTFHPIHHSLNSPLSLSHMHICTYRHAQKMEICRPVTKPCNLEGSHDSCAAVSIVL
jgi:hypothetical protein